MARIPQEPTTSLFGDLSYTQNRKLYAGAPVEEVSKTLDILDKRYNENKKYYNDFYQTTAASEVFAADNVIKDKALTAFQKAKPYIDNNNFIDMGRVNDEITNDIASNNAYRWAIENYQEKLKGDKLEAELRAKHGSVVRFDNPKNYTGALNPDGSRNSYRYDVQPRLDYDDAKAKIVSRIMPDLVANGVLTQTQVDGYLKYGSLEGISKDKIKSLGEALYSAYKDTPEFVQEIRSLKELEGLDQPTAVKNLYKSLILQGTIRTYSKEDVNYVVDQVYLQELEAAKKARVGKTTSPDMVIPSITSEIKVWQQGNQFRNSSEVFNKVKADEQALKDFDKNVMQPFLEKNGLSVVLDNLDNYTNTGVHRGVGDVEMKNIFYKKNTQPNSANQFMPTVLQQPDNPTANTEPPIELYGELKEILNQRIILAQQKKVTEDYLNEMQRKVGQKRGKPDWKPLVYNESQILEEAINKFPLNKNYLDIHPINIAIAKQRSDYINEYKKRDDYKQNQEMLKELNSLIEADSKGFIVNAFTTTFPKYKDTSDLNTEQEKYIANIAGGLNEDDLSTAPLIPRYSTREGVDQKGALSKDDIKNLRIYQNDFKGDGTPFEFLGYRKDETSKSGYVLDFRKRNSTDMTEVYEVDAPSNFTQTLDFYQLHNMVSLPDELGDLRTLDSKLWSQAVSSRSKNGIRSYYGSDSYKAEIEVLTRGDNNGEAPTNLYKIHYPVAGGGYQTKSYASYAEAERDYKAVLQSILEANNPQVAAYIKAFQNANGITSLGDQLRYFEGK